MRGEAATSDELLGELTLVGLAGANKADGAVRAFPVLRFRLSRSA